MKWKHLIATLCVAALLSGCVGTNLSGNYQDIATPILFGSEKTVDWLLENDEDLLRQIVTHNETLAALGM